MRRIDGVSSMPRKLLKTVAVVCAVFCLVTGSMVTVTCLQLRYSDPLNSAALTRLRAQYDASGEEELAENLRQLDWMARRAFFTTVAQIRTGSLLVAVAAVIGGVCFALGTAAGRPDIRLSGAENQGDERWRGNRGARRVIGLVTTGAVCAALAAMFLISRPVWLQPRVSEPAPEAGRDPAPTAEEPAIDKALSWPHFRGWGGVGVATVSNTPTSWDGASGRGIAWKQELPLPGFSSPVVWQKKVFVTCADAEQRLVICYSLDSGEKLWEYVVDDIEGSPEEAPETTDDTGYAAPTPAVCADAICAVFANGDLVCLDLEGEQQWDLNLGVPENHYGHSSSLLIDRGVLFVQYDHAREALLMAFDIKSGDMLWDVEREAISWGSPALVATNDGKKHLILVDESTVRGYDPSDGSLLWQEGCLGGEVAPSPAYENGLVFVANDYAQASGVRIDASGASEVLWTWDDALPDVASPVAANGHVYLATSPGEIVCLAATSGAVVWRQEFETGFYSSPIVVDELIYLTDLEGNTFIFTTGAEYDLRGQATLGEGAFATPAFVDGRIIIRGTKHLFSIGTP